MQFLLDTSICIGIIRGKSPDLVSKVKEHEFADMGISLITVAELEHGVEKSNWPERNRVALELFLVPFTFVEFDYDAALAYGILRAQLEKQGTPIGSLDSLIAAQAISRRLTLVTSNVKEFSRVPSLTVEDWTTE